MAPLLTGKSLILHPRYAQGSLPLARARWKVLGGVIDSAIACPDYDPERNNMKNPHLYFHTYVAALLMLAAVPAEAADVKELFAIDLADCPGKEGRLLEVSYPPGARDMVHWHDAHAFVYMLEGQIVTQLKGQPAKKTRTSTNCAARRPFSSSSAADRRPQAPGAAFGPWHEQPGRIPSEPRTYAPSA